eukprot:755861-Amorphochlora_amoeboformis.AAC.1
MEIFQSTKIRAEYGTFWLTTRWLLLVMVSLILRLRFEEVETYVDNDGLFRPLTCCSPGYGTGVPCATPLPTKYIVLK